MRSVLPPIRGRAARLALGAAAALVGVIGLVAIPAGSRAAFDDVVGGAGFQGEVNFSSASGATVVVKCPNPNQPTGTVQPGQFVNIFTDATPGGPRTGLTDTRVDVHFEAHTQWIEWTAPPAQVLHITKYGEQNKIEIPTSFEAPCSHEGIAIFKPGPGGGGVSDVVDLFFVRVAS